ncbi:unnamed protein product [Phytophthora fragariaefolia]|uniref:Unnamed protein product n=1 Tax=Phytophthora fragariaefolia TaxID=1490495 RepID=A0A9W6XTX4_9STRA|nr:unnamed protein product [Phytophthora fragariaefolia]
MTCLMIAGLLSLFSLLLPYWSEISIVNSIGSGSSGEITSNLEVTFGIWGTCVMIQNRTADDHLRGFLVDSSHFRSESYTDAAEATFTCASFFQEGVEGIHCEAARGYAGGRCSRSQRSTPSSLCAADQPVDMLLHAWDEDQERGTVRVSAAERREVADWLNQFLPDMCGAPGHATVVLSAISTASSVFAIILLLFGVVFGGLESRLVHGGAMTALVAGGLEAALIGVWMFETHVLHHEGNRFGTSFYLSFMGAISHGLAYIVAMRHMQIQKDALVELGLLEEDDESIDDIFKTKKLADDWDDGEYNTKAPSPRKEDIPRDVEVVV